MPTVAEHHVPDVNDELALTTREHEVIAALIPEHLRIEALMVGFAQADVVVAETLQWSPGIPSTNDWLLAHLRTRLPGIELSTVESFQARAGLPGTIQPELLRAEMPVYVWSDQDLGPAYDSSGPSAAFERLFLQTFPGATSFLLAGRPGFSSDGKQALAYFGSCRANRPQAWYWYGLLELSPNGWVVKGVCQQ